MLLPFAAILKWPQSIGEPADTHPSTIYFCRNAANPKPKTSQQHDTLPLRWGKDTSPKKSQQRQRQRHRNLKFLDRLLIIPVLPPCFFSRNKKGKSNSCTRATAEPHTAVSASASALGVVITHFLGAPCCQIRHSTGRDPSGTTGNLHVRHPPV